MRKFRTSSSTRVKAVLSLFAVVVSGASAPSALAELRLANIFSGNMVLQQEQPIPIWGIADPGQPVEVTFGEKTASTTADKNGRWSVEFAARRASFDPLPLSVKSGDKQVTHENILIGEVWLCGGQSNMAPAGHHNSDLEFPCADSDGVRYTRVDSGIAAEPLYDVRFRDGWMPLVAGTMELRRISPVAYYFGIRLNRFLKVPVGIINTSVGGTTAEVWASPASLRAIPELEEINANLGKDLGAFYNGTIVPLSKLRIRGVLFYQGENNTFDLYETYVHSFPCVIRDWRKAFGDDELPFGIITLAGNKGMNFEPNPEGEMTHRHSYTHIRDVHFRTFRSTPKTGLIAIHDLGEDDMHPGCKRDVGERSARWALATVYGFGQQSTRDGGVYHTAPIYREMKVDGDKALLYFDYDPTVDDRRAGKWYKRLPLPRRAREYRGFIIAGEDRRFYPAQAKVRAVEDDNDDVRQECLEVWSEDVAKPVAVRYAWENQPLANASGLHGLPVAPFRTDDWPFIRAEPSWAPDLERRKADNQITSRQSEQWRRERQIGELKRKLRSLGVEIPHAEPPAEQQPDDVEAPPTEATGDVDPLPGRYRDSREMFPDKNVAFMPTTVVLAAAAISQDATAQVRTVFGSGRPALTDATGKLASFNQPFGICPDGKGNLYVADSENHCVRKVSPDGVVSTFAGNGEKGTVDGSARQARFNTPSGVRCDGKGNLFVFSYEENSIRVVGPDAEVRSLIKSREEGCRDGSLVEARIRAPRGLVFDSQGNIFFTDCWNHRIRKITPEGIVSTLAGGGPTGVEAKATWRDGVGTEARFFAPCGLAIDEQDNLYVADAENHRIRKITRTGIVTTIAGRGPGGKEGRAFTDGPAAQSRLNTPTELLVTDDGTVYFSDTYNNRIRKISPQGIVSTVAGTGEAGLRDGPVDKAQLNFPRGIVLRGKTILFADFNNHVVRAVECE